VPKSAEELALRRLTFSLILRPARLHTEHTILALDSSLITAAKSTQAAFTTQGQQIALTKKPSLRFGTGTVSFGELAVTPN
jgi:hypothetical protein